ncbi:MAG: trypsin-like peptidase domain-containing protein [Candidatus Paceibacterota bacterium]|jgi:hypothetical protein
MKNKQKGFIQIPILVAIIVGIFVIGGVGYVGVEQYQNYKIAEAEKEKTTQDKESKMRELAEAQQKSLEEAKSEIEKLKQESATTKEKQQQLESTINIENDRLSLGEIISFWRKSLAYIVCAWSSGEMSAGSGWVESLRRVNPDGSYGPWFPVVHTNKHVVSSDNYRPNKCEITFPDIDKVYKVGEEAGAVLSSENYDNAVITPNNPDSDLIARKIQNYCKKGDPKIGDDVLVLGYPTIGSKTDITATEGIISGIDGDYFITSAKIDAGNSGGIAVLTKNNCFIGMPTYATLGEIESLGRILNAWAVK